LTDPGLPLPTKECPEAIVGGSQPNSRHTYDAITYMSHVDRMFVFGGSLSPCGNFSNETWTFSFADSKWERRSPRGTKPRPEPGAIAVYDPVERRVLVHDSTTLYAYDFESNRYRDLSGGHPIDYHLSGVIHPRQRKLVLVGTGRVYLYDLGPKSWHWRRSLSTKGGDAIVNGVYPGLAYDPVSDRIVAWNGGDVVYSLDLDTKMWTPMRYPGGPREIPENGTFKRWAYVDGLDAFVLVPSGHGNAFMFRPLRTEPGQPVERPSR
jgi:hypothetical protein